MTAIPFHSRGLKCPQELFILSRGISNMFLFQKSKQITWEFNMLHMQLINQPYNPPPLCGGLYKIQSQPSVLSIFFWPPNWTLGPTRKSRIAVVMDLRSHSHIEEAKAQSFTHIPLANHFFYFYIYIYIYVPACWRAKLGFLYIPFFN